MTGGWIVGWTILNVVSYTRWWRIAQREHYLAGRVTRFGFRWWRLWFNQPMLLLAVLGVFGIWLTEPDAGKLAWASVTGLCWLFGPLGLGYRGTTAPLVWTPRLKRTALLSGLFVVGLGMVGWFRAETGWVLIGGALGPVLVDLALAMLGIAERRWGGKWVRQASQKLQQINPTVVGITGSFGKTTTKMYLAHLLGEQARVVASPASFNNLLGLARAINQHLPAGTEIFIAEMGTFKPGEIAEMCRWYPLQIGVLTAVGPVHLERMKTIDNIASAKREIFEVDEIGVLNIDTEPAAQLVEQLDHLPRLITCSTFSSAEVCVSLDGEIRIAGDWVGSVRNELSPTQLSNLATALGTALALGFDPDQIINRVDTLPPIPHRLAVGRGKRGYWVIDDTFNANPAGWESALAELNRLGSEGRRVVVTPGLVEMGAQQSSANQWLARLCVETGAQLLSVGWTNRADLSVGVRSAGAEEHWVRRRQQAVGWVRGNLGEGDAVLYENDLPDHYP